MLLTFYFVVLGSRAILEEIMQLDKTRIAIHERGAIDTFDLTLPCDSLVCTTLDSCINVGDSPLYAPRLFFGRVDG